MAGSSRIVAQQANEAIRFVKQLEKRHGVSKDRCHFCYRELTIKVEANIHHFIPVRFLKQGIFNEGVKEEECTRPACCACHDRWHREIDKSILEWQLYLEVASSVNYGLGMYYQGTEKTRKKRKRVVALSKPGRIDTGLVRNYRVGLKSARIERRAA